MFETNMKSLSIDPGQTVLSAIEKISQNGKKVVFVTDERNVLLGIFSDGDMRRHLLAGGKLDDVISVAMNGKPFVLYADARSEWEDQIKSEHQVSYPVVDNDGRLVDAVFWDDIKSHLDGLPVKQLPTGVNVVIMAGGLGTRLYPYTKVLPKALVPIGDETICTRVMDSFRKCGCKDFHLILNHKKELIKAYYASEAQKGELTFYDEEEPLGTAGGLALLRGGVNGDFIVSNCDVLLRQDYMTVYEFHRRHGNLITMIGARKDVLMPYGIIHVDEQKGVVASIEEKPTMSMLTNVGVYVMNAAALSYIHDKEHLLMTDLIKRCISAGEKVGVYPIPGNNWLDMGQMEEMRQMVSALERRLP